MRGEGHIQIAGGFDPLARIAMPGQSGSGAGAAGFNSLEAAASGTSFHSPVHGSAAMPLSDGEVLPVTRPSQEAFSEALAADWLRCFPHARRAAAADAMACDPKTITNAIGQAHAPKAYTLIAALLADPTALQRTLALFGMKAVPLEHDPANDMMTLAGLSHLSGEWLSAMSDGHRDHRETSALAGMLRPLLPALTALIAEDDRRKAGHGAGAH